VSPRACSVCAHPERTAIQEADIDKAEELWRASERRQRHKLRLANGHAWVGYFDHLALYHEGRAGQWSNAPVSAGRHDDWDVKGYPV
jgi:hypothetical protein